MTLHLKSSAQVLSYLYALTVKERQSVDVMYLDLISIHGVTDEVSNFPAFAYGTSSIKTGTFCFVVCFC